jgi:hypothetical protein
MPTTVTDEPKPRVTQPLVRGNIHYSQIAVNSRMGAGDQFQMCGSTDWVYDGIPMWAADGTLTQSGLTPSSILADPTNTKGDILARTSSALSRLGVGADGQVLTADSTQATGLRWTTVTGGGGGSARCTVSDTPPASPTLGDLWFDSAGVQLYIWYTDPTSSQWVVTVNEPGIGEGGMSDPTTTKGDLIARGVTAPATRLAVGTDGQVLMADSTQTLGIRWATPSPAVTPAGSSGQIQWNNGVAFGASANLFWDNTNGRLGIGTSTPQTMLGVMKASAGFAPLAGTQIFVQNAGAASYVETACAAVGDSCGYIFSSGASLTSYIIDLSTNLQMVTTGARNILFYAGGSERVRITSGGVVGIGTNGPVQPLTVAGATYGNPATSGSGSDGSMAVWSVGHGECLNIGILGGGVWLQSRNNGNYATNYLLALNPNGGKVGIGTLNPPSLLSLIGPSGTGDNTTGICLGSNADATDVYWIWRDTTTGYLFMNGYQATYSGYIWQTNNGTERMRITNGGLVGIGTSGPQGILHAYASGLGSQTYAYFQGNANGVVPSGASIGAVAIGWNYSAGSGEIDFFNLYSANPAAGFRFYQMTNATTASLMLNITSTGLAVTGNCNITGAYQVNGVAINTGGAFTTLVDVTSSRSVADVVYQNTTGKTMFVAVTVSSGTFSSIIGPTNPPTIGTGTISGINATLCFMVPANWYYKLHQYNPPAAYQMWIECY